MDARIERLFCDAGIVGKPGQVEASCRINDARCEVRPMIDLTNKGIRRLLYAALDDISDTARATNRARMSARLLGRALALRLGLPVWECQRVAKAWKRERPRGGLISQGVREP